MKTNLRYRMRTNLGVWIEEAVIMLLVAVLLAVMLFTSGCATLMGAASYSYETVTQEGKACRVNIASRRDVAGPVTVGVGENCTLNVSTGSLTGGQVDPAQIANATLQVLNQVGALKQPLPKTQPNTDVVIGTIPADPEQ